MNCVYTGHLLNESCPGRLFRSNRGIERRKQYYYIHRRSGYSRKVCICTSFYGFCREISIVWLCLRRTFRYGICDHDRCFASGGNANRDHLTGIIHYIFNQALRLTCWKYITTGRIIAEYCDNMVPVRLRKFSTV